MFKKNMSFLTAFVLAFTLMCQVFVVNVAAGSENLFEFNKATGTILKYIGSNKTAVTVPSQIDGVPVRAIADYAFPNAYASYDIQTVTFEEGTVPLTIGSYVFTYCHAKTVKLPSNLVEIKPSAFYSSYVEELYIPNSVTTIGDSAFIYSRLKTISIPKNAKLVGNYHFYGCSPSITYRDVKANYTMTYFMNDGSSSKVSGTYPESSQFAMYTGFSRAGYTLSGWAESPSGAVKYAPNAIIAMPSYNYNLYAVWSKAENLFEFNKTTGTILKYIGSNRTSVTVPSQIDGVPVRAIADYAFPNAYASYDLQTVTFEEGTVPLTIGSYVFTYCHAKTIKLPSNLVEIKPSAFYSSYAEELYIPSSVTTIGDSAFIYSKLKTISIPRSAKLVGNYHLYGCNAQVTYR